MDPLQGAGRAARDGAEAAECTAETVTEHPVFGGIARGGFVMSGLVHVLIGWFALRVALGDSGQDADQSGALRTVAAAPGGNALRFAAGGGSDSGQQTSELTAGLLGSPVGRGAVVLIGLVVLAIGGYHVVKGAGRVFEDDLRPPGDQRISMVVIVTGVIGYIAKGVALIVVGILFGWAAIGSDPEKATGLDGAFQTVASLPAGAVLLVVVAVGVMLYGVYAVLRSRYAPL